MKLEWIGHSCFRMTAQDGTVVITDPYDAKTGYDMVPLQADLITMSHEHGDHCCEEQIVGTPKIVHGVEEAHVGGVVSRAVMSYHDDAQGAKRGVNAIRIFEIDGLKVVHMGDQGCMPDEGALAAITNADVMLLPVGGFFTVDAKEAKAIVDAAKPKLVVPMHVRLKKGGYVLIAGPQPFLKLMGAQGVQPVRELVLQKGSAAQGVQMMIPQAGKL